MEKATLHSLYRSPNKVRMIKSKYLARMEENINSLKILNGKSTGKKLIGKPRRSWENKSDLIEIYVNSRNWID